MVAPGLADYEYQYKDSGFKLNGNSAVPFFDVSKTTGLSDLPEYDAKIDDVDSIDGGLINVRFSKHRIVTVEGILYVAPNAVEATIETLVQNFTPDNTDWPFYFKHPGVQQKYVMAKALGFKSDVETLRRVGACNCLITLGCENPLKRIDNPDVLLVNNTNNTIQNTGAAKTWPIITITGGTFSVINLQNVSTGQTLTLTRNQISSDVVVVDFRNMVVYVNGIQNTAIASGTFWAQDPFSTRTIKYTITGATAPTQVKVQSYSGWM